MYSFSQSQKHAALEMLLLYQQHYWNLTENFCQITILFPWRKIRCIHQSADIFVKPFFWRNFVNIFLKRILKWTDCWLALPVLEWSGGDCFFSAAVVLNFWCAKFLATLHLYDKKSKWNKPQNISSFWNTEEQQAPK